MITLWSKGNERKEKDEYLYGAIYYACVVSKRSDMDQTPCLPFLCKRLPDGATFNWSGRHVVAAYYLSIDPKGITGWVRLVGWLIGKVIFSVKIHRK